METEEEAYLKIYGENLNGYLAVLAFRMALELHSPKVEDRHASVDGILKVWADEQKSGFEKQKEVLNDPAFLTHRIFSGLTDDMINSSIEKQEKTLDEIVEVFKGRLKDTDVTVSQQLKAFSDAAKMFGEL